MIASVSKASLIGVSSIKVLAIARYTHDTPGSSSSHARLSPLKSDFDDLQQGPICYLCLSIGLWVSREVEVVLDS